MAEVNRRQTSYVTVTFLDKDDQPLSPTSATYEILDLKSGTVVKEETPITPISSSVKLTLSPDDNDIITEANRRERRRIIVKAAYGDSQQIVGTFEYTVINVKKAAS